MSQQTTINIKTDQECDKYLTGFGKAVLVDRYLMPGESFQELFARVASSYADNQDHADRIYSYISKMWFMPATPILSNGGTKRGMPISCFINEVDDTLQDIVDTWTENVWLASRGGGIGTYWGNVRSINENVRGNGKTSGIVPFIKVQDSMTLAISQGSLRRGSTAVYLPIDHPEIEEFLDLRRPTGGDFNRRCLNIHHGVCISDKFMRAIENDEMWNLVSPCTGKTQMSLRARDLWTKLLSARIETGEPYILYTDTVNNNVPAHHKKLGLKVKTSNLCSEITLPTGLDHLGKDRTAVCCLSSLNLEYYKDWIEDKNFILDVMRFLDNVLQDFIDTAPDDMCRAKYSAMRERSIGLGVMGLHSFLQMNNVPFGSVTAKVWNKKIFSSIKTAADNSSKVLSHEKGPCPDAEEVGVQERFSNKTAIAPTASISIICGNTSPGVEPYVANIFTQKTLSGSFTVKNKHLEKLLETKGFNNGQVWLSIATHEGSVQHLTFLSDDEKEIFKTAYEIEQKWLIELAGDRSQFIDQAQSLNVFLPGNVSKKELHETHYQAWKKNVKSLYYCRSTSIQRSDKVSHRVEQSSFDIEHISSRNDNDHVDSDYDECLSCQ